MAKNRSVMINIRVTHSFFVIIMLYCIGIKGGIYEQVGRISKVID